MAAKIPQALKFTEGLSEDLKFLAGVKGMTYNGYVESILSSHVLVQKRTVMEMKSSENKNNEKAKFPLTPNESIPEPSKELVKSEEDDW